MAIKINFNIVIRGAGFFANVHLLNAASSIEELKSKIDEKNKQKTEIEKEIAEYEQKAIEAGKAPRLFRER